MKLAIIGSGMIAKEFLTITPYLKDLELTAIYGRKKSEEKLNNLKSEYGIKNIYYDYDKLLSCDADTYYIAMPNSLHFEYAKKALLNSKNVIVEKPFTVTYEEALKLSNIAREKKLFIFEAITTLYLPNYKKIKELLPVLGNIKIVQCNFSQYSSRYDNFIAGIIAPAFDKELSGGALMDLNIYNIHYAVGLFGRPKNVQYFPNIEKGIDTSGVLILDYESFKCTLVGAKDCKAHISNSIQGDNGCIYQESPVNSCGGFELLKKGESILKIDENTYDNRMVNEFIEFIDMVKNKDLEKCYDMLNHSLMVSEVLTIARNKSRVYE